MRKIIDGKKIAESIYNSLEKDILRIRESRNTGLKLAVLSVGNDISSEIYINCKRKACERLGIGFEAFIFKSDSKEDEIVNCIKKLNLRKDITGILIQLPLPKHTNEMRILSSVDENKDVDCLNPANIGKLFFSNYNLEENLIPCTALAVIEIFKQENINVIGKRVAILGRSIIVGKPLASILSNMNATVTVCHTNTSGLQEICKNSHVIISATGKKSIVNEKMVNKDSIVIDVGIVTDADGRICGDVDLKKVLPKVKAITPVPGGVGPVTVAMLLRNIIIAAKKCTNF